MFCSVWRGRPSLARINNLNKPQLCWVFSPRHRPQNCIGLMSLLNRAAEPLCQSPESWRCSCSGKCSGRHLQAGGEQEAMNCDTTERCCTATNTWWWEMFLLSFGERQRSKVTTASKLHWLHTKVISVDHLLSIITRFRDFTDLQERKKTVTINSDTE